MEKQHKLNYLTPDTEVVETRYEGAILLSDPDDYSNGGEGITF